MSGLRVFVPVKRVIDYGKYRVLDIWLWKNMEWIARREANEFLYACFSFFFFK
jgi:hypothetical protein